MMGRRRSPGSSTTPANTPMPPPPGGQQQQQQQQDVAGLVQLLRKHQHFASAAAYNLQCLYSCFHQGGKGGKGDGSGPAEQDAATAELLEAAGGVEAIAACLQANTSGDKAQSNAISLTLVQAASKVLSRFLEVRPSGAVRLEAAGGLATCVQALRAIDADERPAECLRLLGLMAAADPAYAAAVVAGKGAVDLLLQTLKAALAGDDREKALHATLALGAIAAAGLLAASGSPLACEAALPDLPRREALGELVLKELTRDQQDRQMRRVTPRLLRTTTAKAVANAAAAGGTGAAGGGGGRTSPLFFATTDGEKEGSHKTQALQSSPSSSGPVALLRSQVMVLLWLTTATDEGRLTERMAQAGTPKLLVEAAGDLEDQLAPADLLPAIGQLLHHVVGGSALDHARARLSADAVSEALRALDAQDAAAPSSPSAAADASTPLSPVAALESSLRLVGAVVLAPAGRAAVMTGAVAGHGQAEEDGEAPGSVLEGLLLLCQAEAAPYPLVKTVLRALRALGRLAADARYGPLLLQHRALDVAMGVLRRDREGGDVDGLPLEVVAAAATLVARLTEIMATQGGGDSSPAPAGAAQADADALELFAASHRRRQSMGWSDKKLDALRCAMAAHARHPDSALLFKSVVDLAVSYMRRAEQPSEGSSSSNSNSNGDNAGPSPGELRLVSEAVATLQRLREESLASAKRQHQQQLLADRVWGERGALACAGCLRQARGLENPELAAGVVGLLDSTAAGDGQLALALGAAAGEALHAALAASAALGLAAEAKAQRGRLLALLGPYAAVTVAADEATKEEGAAETAAAAGEDEKSVAGGVAGGNLDTSRASLFHDARAELMVTPPPSLPAEAAPGVAAEPEPPAPTPVEPAPPEPTAAPAPAEEAEEQSGMAAAMGAFAVSVDAPSPPSATLPPPAVTAAAGPWVQCVDARRRVLFFNTETGQAQWEAPEEMLAFWAAAAELEQPGEDGASAPATATLPLACEMDGWQARFDPRTCVAFCEPPPSSASLSSGGPHRRYWCLPATAPPGLLGAGLLAPPTSTRRKEQEAAAETTNLVPPDELREGEGNPLLDGNDLGSEHGGGGEEEEDQPEMELLDGLRALRDDLESVAGEAQGQAQATAAGALVGRHAELLRRVRARVARTDVEDAVSCALRKALGVVEALAETSGYYIERYDRELRAHEGKGINSALEATMGTVKGEIVRHTPADLPTIVKAVGMVERQPPEKLFKESHLLIKRLVVEVAGKQGSDTLWTLSALDIQTIPAHYLTQLGQALLRLCVAYDNLTPQQKRTLTTASEIIKNKSWLVALAVRCVEAGTLHSGSAKTTTTGSSTFTSTLSSSFASTARHTGATPPSGSKLLASGAASTSRVKSSTTTTTTRSSISPPTAARTANSAAATTMMNSQSSISSTSYRTPPSAGASARRGGPSPPLGSGQSTPSPAAGGSLPRCRTPPPPVRLSPPVATPSPRDASPRDKGPPPGSPPFLAGKAKPRTGAAGTGGGAGTPSPLGVGGVGGVGVAGGRAPRSGIKPPSSPVRGSGGSGKR